MSREQEDRLMEVQRLRSEGRILGELFDLGFSADEIVRGIGTMRLAGELGLLDEVPDGEEPSQC